MSRKIIAVVFSLALGAVFFAASCTNTSNVASIAPESACPVTGCANGSCHGYDNVPEPDGATELTCPVTSCVSVECHAWSTLRSNYHQASDASLTLWIMIPSVILAAAALAARKVRR